MMYNVLKISQKWLGKLSTYLKPNH
jgi:hypothetical protein